jgi:hypothetical protein
MKAWRFAVVLLLTLVSVRGASAQQPPIRIGVIYNWGPIADRSQEYLGSSDSVITRYRRVLIDAIKTNAAGGTPVCFSEPTPYASRQAHAVIHPHSVDWRDAIALQTT